MWNEIHGVDHYSYALNTFSGATFVGANSFAPPGTPGKFTIWTNHAGGNQGIVQKKWTIDTILAITRVANRLGYEYFLKGSGDNQILFMQQPGHEGTPNNIDNVKTQLVESFAMIGLTMKRSESLHSSRLFCYQKKILFWRGPIWAWDKDDNQRLLLFLWNEGNGDSCYPRHWLPGGSTLATPTLATRHWLPIRPTLATPAPSIKSIIECRLLTVNKKSWTIDCEQKVLENSQSIIQDFTVNTL